MPRRTPDDGPRRHASDDGLDPPWPLGSRVRATGRSVSYRCEWGDRMTGTFAVGSSKDLAIENFGSYVDPFAAFDSISVPGGPNVWSLTFSATVAAPEPPTWLMLMAGGAGLLIVRGLARRRGVARRVAA